MFVAGECDIDARQEVLCLSCKSDVHEKTSQKRALEMHTQQVLPTPMGEYAV
jgi:hypothetical protein